MDHPINVCSWKEVDGFYSLLEFERFDKWLIQEISVGYAEEVQVKQDYSVVGHRERWFKNKVSGQVWRLVDPDPPFYGVFELIRGKISNWTIIQGFQNRKEFEQFEKWIKNEIKIGEAEELLRKPIYDGDTSHQGRWFKHRASGEIWRLQSPDEFFKGSFYLMSS